MSSALLDAAVRVEYQDRGPVLDDFQLQVYPGEIFGLAGPSGCGKSSFALAALKLLDPWRAKVSGTLRFGGQDLLGLSEKTMRGIRGKDIGLVLQSPLAALNPRRRIGAHFQEAWQAHSTSAGWRDRVGSTLEEVRLPSDDNFLRLFPKQLSVGMAQRVLIAMAVLHRPRLVIADEATSALDLITQADVLDLFRGLNRTHGISILFITHDLAAAASVCHRIGIVHKGRVAEVGSTRQVFGEPQHPYTRQLMAALPRLEAPDPSGLLQLGLQLDALAGSSARVDHSDPVSALKSSINGES